MLLEQNSFQGKEVCKQNIKTATTTITKLTKLRKVKNKDLWAKDLPGKKTYRSKYLRTNDLWEKTYGTKDPHGQQTINI